MSDGLLRNLAAKVPSKETTPTRTRTRSVGLSMSRQRRQEGYLSLCGLDVVQIFRDHGHYGRVLESGKHAVLCPWSQEHSDTRGAEASDSVLWEGGASSPPVFHCSHAHCAGRKLADVLAHWHSLPTPEEYFRRAKEAEGEERVDAMRHLAHAVCADPLEQDRWAEQVKAAELATKRAFLDEAAKARREVARRFRNGPGEPGAGGEPNRYFAEGGRLWVERTTRDGPTMTALCNFEAWIVREEVRDDGAEQSSLFVVAGRLQSGRELPEVAIPGEQLAGMSWVTGNWGHAAIVYAGQSTRDHLRVAIQTLSESAETRTVYTHTGWRKRGDQWVYLHAGGAIGPDGPVSEPEVAFGDSRLAHYSLPPPPSGEPLRRAVFASLALLDLAQDEITFPLLAAVYRAPLGEVAPIDLALFLAGGTGSQKSELTAMAQAHYGANFHAKALPGN